MKFQQFFDLAFFFGICAMIAYSIHLLAPTLAFLPLFSLVIGIRVSLARLARIVSS